MAKNAFPWMLPATLAVILLIGAGAVYLTLRPAPGPSPATIDAAGTDIGGPFELTAQNGETVTSEELIDGPTLIYFGYTYCPDVCPFDVQRMADVVDLLAERGTAVKPVFITVDPERDDVEALGYYAEAMHPDMVALTGTDEEIAKAAKAYRVVYSRVEAADSAAVYLMNHSAYTYLATPGGVLALFRRDYPAEQIADDIEVLLAGR